jgi:hypothetical protein
MSNKEEAGRVVQIFGVQFQDRISTEQYHFHILLTSVFFIPVFWHLPYAKHTS